MFDAGVVPGRDEARVEPVGVVCQRPEFYEVVARNAWVRRSSGGVVVDEALDDRAAERFFEIEHVVWDSQRRGAAARVVEIVDAATTLGLGRFRRLVHLH